MNSTALTGLLLTPLVWKEIADWEIPRKRSSSDAAIKTRVGQSPVGLRHRSHPTSRKQSRENRRGQYAKDEHHAPMRRGNPCTQAPTKATHPKTTRTAAKINNRKMDTRPLPAAKPAPVIQLQRFHSSTWLRLGADAASCSRDTGPAVAPTGFSNKRRHREDCNAKPNISALTPKPW